MGTLYGTWDSIRYRGKQIWEEGIRSTETVREKRLQY